jgi:hypothetical protein
MRAERRLLFCGGYLGLIWLIAVLPLVSILVEYNIPLCSGTSLGWFFATLYGSFFIYPVTIGGLCMAALVLPLATLFSIRKSNTERMVLIGFYIFSTLALCALEFLASPDAPFQVPPSRMIGTPGFLGGLQDACRGTPFTSLKANQPSITVATQSYTGWIYYVGFTAQVLMQNALFVVLLAFLYFPRTKVVRNAPYLGDKIFFILGYAIFLGSIWCLFRLTYRRDMMDLFTINNQFVGDYLIVALYAIALAVFVAYFGFNLEQVAKTISQIGQLVVFIGGAAFVQFKQADHLFGTRASIVNIFALFMLFIFVSALTMAFVLRSSQRERRG